ncbi:hypothetical protein CDEST_14098 [Colletotrichum destructivum]|uniref:Uncharacterized protein n=1 Tax=Colletotrichum destructivum TaxID=34406 RepID=A0AAX4J0L3_9PEZI|nr:hypothetical protein CDEST_14098 [Colletotrichum destructivum]
MGTIDNNNRDGYALTANTPWTTMLFPPFPHSFTAVRHGAISDYERFQPIFTPWSNGRIILGCLHADWAICLNSRAGCITRCDSVAAALT